MNDITVISKGYTVIYDTADGGIGFIGIDDHSGGYPYFSSSVEYRHIRKDIWHAQADLESAKNMDTYYGRENVHFGTMRVVEYSHVFQEIDVDADKILFDSVISKLTDAELDAVKRHLKEELK